jgi:hypothetical protein
MQSTRSAGARQAAIWLAVVWASALGCARVTAPGSAGSGGGTPGVGGAGAGGGGGAPGLDGLTALVVAPASADVALALDPASGKVTGSAAFTATGTVRGVEQDVTALVQWPSASAALTVTRGLATVTAPGTYAITARSGSLTASATLTAALTGRLVAPGFAGAGDFDGTAPGSGAAIAYPLDGAIIPANLGPITVHVSRTAAQTEAKLTFTGDLLALDYLAPCEAGAPGAGCYVTLPATFSDLLVGASRNQDVRLAAALANPGGRDLVASAPISLAWASAQLEGGLYYWTTITAGAVAGYEPPAGATSGTAVQRYDLGRGTSAPELVWTDQGAPPAFAGSPPARANSAPTDGNGPWGEATCIGCHAITPDGRTMALSIGGSGPSDLALLDIGSQTLALLDPTAAPATATGAQALRRDRKADFATLIAFNPAGTTMVDMYRGAFYLRGFRWTPMPVQTVPVTFDPDAPLRFTAVGSERLTDPFWSADGSLFVFSSYQAGAVGLPNGDLKDGAQIWIATSDGTSIHDDARLLAPREARATHYDPAISSDGRLVVYNRSSCDGPQTPGSYGVDPCDGYDDPSAALWLTTPSGAAPMPLARANGGDDGDNSWPRFSPSVGRFRDQALYWVAFSSRRPYGLQVNQAGLDASKPQLWVAAVTSSEFTGDPSHAAVWLPNQNHDQAYPTGNHVPQWVSVAVVIP